MPEYIHTMLATLGGKPQVVTFTLDLLLQRNIPISEVIVIHPEASQPRLKHSLNRLNAEFVGDTYRFDGRTIHFRSHVLRIDGATIDDIVDDASAMGSLNTIHRLIRDLKLQNRCIHLSVTGGRRLMSLLAISAAQLHFDHLDRIWHIYTPDAVRERAKEGALMHFSANDGVQLIQGPFVPWGTYFPTLPDASAETQRYSEIKQMDTQLQKRCQEVLAQATEREQEVLRAFAQDLNPQEVAQRLNISTKTIDTHKTKLLSLYRNAWAIEPDIRLDYHYLRKAFAPYFNRDEYTSSQ